jgi:excinuclease ABC subunit A
MPKIAQSKSIVKNNSILIKGAKVHNLKNIDLEIPRNKLVVITGLSGSGKSSLAFDTLYAEGQRRYVESLSSYARQFLGKLDKPNVDYIKGISPAIAIEQKVISRNSRSTVGTSTEIYDYLKLLFARIGKTYSPVSGQLVKRNTVTDVTDYLSQFENTSILVYAPVLVAENTTIQKQLQLLSQQGFTRVKIDKEIKKIDSLLDQKFNAKSKIYVVVDRILFEKADEESLSRIADSVQTAFYEGHGICCTDVATETKLTTKEFSNLFEADGISFEEPSVHFFSFNNPIGACKVCEGFGSVIGIDVDAVVPDKSLSIYDDAVACWRGEKMQEWKNDLIKVATKFDFPIHKPYYQLTDAQKKLLWTGNKYFSGLNDFFKFLEENSYKIQYRVMISRYRGKTTCPDCNGTRLRKDANYVKINDHSISDLVVLSIEKLSDFFNQLKLPPQETKIASRLLIEVKSRLQFLNDVGLGYLTLNRLSNTLSGGESQRINLATSLGSSLVGSMYILDEPSIGLHSHDTEKLIVVLKALRNLGNTVIVVEHDEEIMNASDLLIDIGPFAGIFGGEIVFIGNHKDILKEKKSITAKYLNGTEKIEVPKARRKWKDFVECTKVFENNLKGFDVKFPLHTLIAITGVSGSGKSTLVKKILYPSMKKILGGMAEKTGEFGQIQGSISKVKAIEFIDQNPIGKSSRSNPVTYIKAFDEIRNLFAKQPLAQMRAYKSGHFSFNVPGGRCDTCEGEGLVTIEMQFMADIQLLCETCKGKRYKDETLEIKYLDKTISDVLDLSVDEAIDFFREEKKNALNDRIVASILPLQEVGLGYVKLGQSSSTLSGGEAQRIKLASFLGKGINLQHTLFIFDEPTTGLHFHDIKKLLVSFDALLKNGHSILVIEHNLDVIKCADWVIDLGPLGGENGGHLLFEGTPEELVKHKTSLTGKYLKDKL